jgi:hypothetical protein
MKVPDRLVGEADPELMAQPSVRRTSASSARISGTVCGTSHRMQWTGTSNFTCAREVGDAGLTGVQATGGEVAAIFPILQVVEGPEFVGD